MVEFVDRSLRMARTRTGSGMRAAVYHGRRDVRIENVSSPGPPGPGEVLIDVEAASICGTDVTEYVHGPHKIPLTRRNAASGHGGPTILGHEFVGRIRQLGADAGTLAIEDRVVPGAASWCRQCPRCREGRSNLCESYFVYGLHANGGMAEQVVVPAAMCHVVPDIGEPYPAAMAQPAAIAQHVVRRACLAGSDTVVVIGVGGIGAFVLASAARANPQQLIAVDISDDRLTRATRLGATTAIHAVREDVTGSISAQTAGRGCDVALEASGTAAGVNQALASVRTGGHVVLVGIPAQQVQADLGEAVTREITILTSNGHVCDDDVPAAIDLLTTTDVGALMLGSVISLDRLCADGLDLMAAGRAAGKVVVDLR